MKDVFSYLPEERDYLRSLARKQAEYAAEPIMLKRKKIWYNHNSLNGERPLIVMEMDSFEHEMFPRFRCTSPLAIETEKSLLRHIINYEMIGDDKVVPDYYSMDWEITIDEFGLDLNREYAENYEGESLGYRDEHPIKTIQNDISKLKPAVFQVDRNYTRKKLEILQDMIGDILPIQVENQHLRWHFTPSEKVVRLMGLQQMMYSLFDEPDQMHKLYSFINENILAFAKWMENEGLLTLNNANHFIGSGSYGFTNELPQDNKQNQKIERKDLWGNLNSQETVGISAKMYREFIFPYYYELAEQFGLVYYGCCEPVHSIWNCCISQLPNLRKVSISAWSDEKFMGEALSNSSVIYSRKPSPNFIGVGKILDSEAFSQHILKTLQAAKDCHLEFIFRDIYTLSGDLSKPGKAVNIVRQLIDENW